MGQNILHKSLIRSIFFIGSCTTIYCRAQQKIEIYSNPVVKNIVLEGTTNADNSTINLSSILPQKLHERIQSKVYPNFNVAYKTHTHSRPIPDKYGRYYIISTGFTITPSSKIVGNLTESFSYSVKDFSTNTVAAQTFNGSTKSAFSSVCYIDLINMEFVKKKHSFSGGIGINSNQSNEYSVYLKGGYGLVFPINFIKLNGRSFLLFKPSINLLAVTGYNKSLGTIDNKNKEVYLLGHTAGKQFTTDGSGDNIAQTFDANLLDISYQNSRTIAMPKISITNKPTGRIYWGIDASWLLPLSRRSKFTLTQEGDNKSDQNYLGSADFSSYGSITTFNNATIQKAPSIGALYFGINLGIYLRPLKKR